MGYFSCNAESAISTCDSHNFNFKRHKTHKQQHVIRHFTYEQLTTATNSFSKDTFLGKGSHGSVYKATLDNGQFIAAVKRTTQSTADNEIEILSKLHHSNIVNLIGFCNSNNVNNHKANNKLIVVEYMPNGSLHDLLHRNPKPPGWTKRIRFAVQIAKAVQALHSSNPPVIHRDIKSSNVLIDENGNARLSDFGLSLMGHVEDVKVQCTPPAGTLGYLDPTYLSPSDLSLKSDVFSFGILLLEIISGRNAIDLRFSPPNVVDWAVPLIKKGEFHRVCDQRIGLSVDPNLIRKMAVLAAKCVRATVEKRPSMGEVVEGLKWIRKRAQVSISMRWCRTRRDVEEGEFSSLAPHDIDVSMQVGCSKEVVKRLGSKRNGKVSNVVGIEEYNGNDEEMISLVGESQRGVRSKSIGSLSDMMNNLDLSNGKSVALIKRRKSSVVVKLNKSRSMGVLQSPNLVGYNRGVGRKVQLKKEVDSSKLIVSLDERSDTKLLEKPLVS